MLRGEFVSEECFAAAMGEVIGVADANEVSASQFELLTSGALKLFADEGFSWAVLEAGLGARYDATSAAAPEAVVLTNVGLDHTEYLGETVEDISREPREPPVVDYPGILGEIGRASCRERV